MTKTAVITELPTKLTARTLRDSRIGKNVNWFRTKKKLYDDLGLENLKQHGHDSISRS